MKKLSIVIALVLIGLMAGGDADLWSTPYFQGGTNSGFCLGSGLLSGEAAAKNL